MTDNSLYTGKALAIAAGTMLLLLAVLGLPALGKYWLSYFRRAR